MSKIFMFGFLSEDIAQKNFLMKYLENQHPSQFVEKPEFGWRIKASNKDDVDANLNAALLFKLRFSLDVLFIGRDTDSADKKSVASCRTKIATPFEGHPGVVSMIPVQCIEHWLWYLKWKRENPDSTKNESLDAFKRIEAKNAVYGEKNKAEVRILIANELLTGLDVPWLEQRSDSFKHFHNQVKAFVTQTT